MSRRPDPGRPPPATGDPPDARPGVRTIARAGVGGRDTDGLREAGPARRLLPPASARTREAGLTLIEIMVVVLVLGILAALVVPNVFSHVSTAKRESARAQMEMLNAALDAYRLHNGDYPTTEQGLEALREQPTTPPVPDNWRGPYLRKDVPRDPWGNAYVYRSPATRSEWGYDLLSYGDDGEPGGEAEAADIRAWE